MHIATHYVDDEMREFANHTMYLNGLGRYPERIKNLHMLYALVIRSINLVHSQLEDSWSQKPIKFDSGICKEKDEITG